MAAGSTIGLLRAYRQAFEGSAGPARRLAMAERWEAKAGSIYYDPRILFNEHIAAEGTLVFDHACRMGLEGIVAKRLDLPYRSGKAKCWVKVKNPKSPAMLRVEDGTW
jgi:ATP-dependent DNA ligase